MKIALIGYGKMGKTIERLATEKGHQIVLKTNQTPTRTELLDSGTQVAIEFSNPDAAYDNLVQLLQNNIPVVCGTTGWLAKMPKIEEKVEQYNGSFLYASNFSLGVNLFFALAQKSAQLMRDHGYSISIEEIHHTQKKDAPSGTAITLAEKVMLETSFENWHLAEDKADKNSLPITAIREENVPGTHTLTYASKQDKIELTHTAFSRDGFALGAIKAAEYILDKKGIMTMKDVLGI